MTNQPSDRLDRIEALLFQVARQQQVNTEAIESNNVSIQENTAAIAELRASSEALLATVNQHQDNFEVLVQEIRGLRAENRRILAHLFGEQT